MRRLTMLMVLLLIAAGAAFAQEGGDPTPNDPTAREDANACYAGGTMDGKCALDADGDGVLEDFEEDWAWECGWFQSSTSQRWRKHELKLASDF